jgi:hypothetical protein
MSFTAEIGGTSQLQKALTTIREVSGCLRFGGNNASGGDAVALKVLLLLALNDTGKNTICPVLRKS